MIAVPRLSKKSQGSPEFVVVLSFVFLVFMIIVLIVMQKQDEAYDLEVFLDAKRVTTSMADNINMISKNGNGYYRYFSLPEDLHGVTDYNLTVYGNYLEINYDGKTWGTSLITNNISVIHLEKNESSQNCIINENGLITINDICGSSDAGCGSVQSCDPMDTDDCASCDTPMPEEVNQNSLSSCGSYGCSDDEWHFYRVTPARDGNLKVTFRGTGNMTGDYKTDLIFYDYSANGCSSPIQVSNLETQNSHLFPVAEGNTYIIGLDSDSPGCQDGGDYWLKTELK